MLTFKLNFHIKQNFHVIVTENVRKLHVQNKCVIPNFFFFHLTFKYGYISQAIGDAVITMMQHSDKKPLEGKVTGTPNRGELGWDIAHKLLRGG